MAKATFKTEGVAATAEEEPWVGPELRLPLVRRGPKRKVQPLTKLIAHLYFDSSCKPTCQLLKEPTMARKNIFILSLACLVMTTLSAAPVPKISLTINSRNSFVLFPKPGGKRVGNLVVTPLGTNSAWDMGKDPFAPSPNEPITLTERSIIKVGTGNCTFEITGDTTNPKCDLDLIIIWDTATGTANPPVTHTLSFNIKDTLPNKPAFIQDTTFTCDSTAYKVDDWKGNWLLLK
jgi:hypothetical protein